MKIAEEIAGINAELRQLDAEAERLRMREFVIAYEESADAARCP